MSNETQSSTRRSFGLGTLVLVGLLCAAIAGGAAFTLARSGHGHADEKAAEAPKELWQCPMHPAVVSDHADNCPICGMKLVKVEQKKVEAPQQAKAQPAEVKGLVTVDIDPERQQLIGLKTAEVTEGAVAQSWRTTGKVAIDETRVRRVSLKIPGFVERIHANFVGQPVKKGDPLFSLYSPELVAAQEEYLLALRTSGALGNAGAFGSDGDTLIKAARRKLALWDVPERELDRLARSGEPMKSMTFYSPVNGVVTKKDIVEGSPIDAGATPYEIVDLSSVWVLADVYESELSQVQNGMAATLKLAAFPNREFEGKVLFVDPLLDPQTRTVKVRLAFPNPKGELRPELFGEVVLRGASREGLKIPADAVVDSGTEKVVFVALGDGKFQPRKVTLGAKSDQMVEVVSGLKRGEQVVTRANFLIDSESRLRSALGELGAAGDSSTSERGPVAPDATHSGGHEGESGQVQGRSSHGLNAHAGH